MERLQKVIAKSGLCSRRKAETLIAEGHVSVNGETVTEMGIKVSKKDRVLVDGSPLKNEALVHYVLYKPEGCVSTTDDDKKRRTVLDYVQSDARVYPVGRLDYDTSGLLILTNDGEFTNLVIHPNSGIEKEYQVTVAGFLRKETSRKIERGVALGPIKTKKAKIFGVAYNKEKETTQLTIVITEGKYRQIRRVFEMFGHPVNKLKRVRFGCVTLEHMSRGEVRLLKPHEYKRLRLLATEHERRSKP